MSSRVLLAHQPLDGGVARHVADAACGLLERGFEVVLLAPERLREAPPACDFRRLDLRRALVPGADAAAVAGFARVVREVRPDLIHAHSSKAGAIARLARAFAPRTPVVYSPHGYAFAGHFERQLERRAYRALERALAPLASCVACVCEAEATLARAIGPARRVRVVHNGVAPAAEVEPDARYLPLREAGPLLCAITLLRPGKGLETLIDALPIVVRAHPDVQLLVGGGGDAGALAERARRLGVGDAVHFAGPIESPARLLACADVFVHPSWAESFPYAILEAMAAGLPIVATDVGGVGEAVSDGATGMLVPPRDAAALADALTRMLGDERRRRALAAAGRERVRTQFTLERMRDGLIAIYEQLL